MDYKVVVVHGICQLLVPLKYDHPFEGYLIGFIQDTFNKKATQDLQTWGERLQRGKGMVLPTHHGYYEPRPIWTSCSSFPETCEMVKTSKLIPIPIFLVPLLMNKGKPKTPIATFQQFFDTFWEQAPLPLKEWTQHVLDFLLAATGFDSLYDEDNPPTSQLAIQVEEHQVDTMLGKWGVHQFENIVQLARKFGNNDGTRIKWESLNSKVDKSLQLPRKKAQEPASCPQEITHKDNQW